MFFSKKIKLFWWNEIQLQGKSKENYGDLLGKYLVEKISKKHVEWVNPNKLSFFSSTKVIYVTIGSILTNVTNKCVVWGSGIISKESTIKKAVFLAVRGPQTRAFLLAKGYEVPEVYGDPALLLPDYYNPKVHKEYALGIIPHYTDLELINGWFKNDKNILIIDLMTNDIEATTNEILSCKRIVSSSLHGIILPHAYQIPAVWQKFSNNVFGDDIKYQDYFESVSIKPYNSMVLEEKPTLAYLESLFDSDIRLPEEKVIEQLKKSLMEVCPFKA